MGSGVLDLTEEVTQWGRGWAPGLEAWMATLGLRQVPEDRERERQVPCAGAETWVPGRLGLLKAETSKPEVASQGGPGGFCFPRSTVLGGDLPPGNRLVSVTVSLWLL